MVNWEYVGRARVFLLPDAPILYVEDFLYEMVPGMDAAGAGLDAPESDPG